MTVREEQEAEREARLEFRTAVLAVDGGCLLHDDPADCVGDVEAHHVISQQQLRRVGRYDLLWDPNNGMGACDKGHDRHHLAFDRIPLESIPERCLAFAREHGFEDVIARYYPSEAS